jgi:hypothetical protein
MPNRRWLDLLASVLTGGVLASGCGSVGASPMEAHASLSVVAALHGAPDSQGPPNVHFTRDIEPIFMSTCSGEYCHGNTINSPERAYRFLVDQPSAECEGRSLVVPGRPDASYLMEKVGGQEVCAGERMPRGAGNSLSPKQIQLMRDWIHGGARFD